MLSRVMTSWMEAFGTSVFDKELEITVEIALNVSVDSLPPGTMSATYPIGLSSTTRIKWSRIFDDVG